MGKALFQSILAKLTAIPLAARKSSQHNQIFESQLLQQAQCISQQVNCDRFQVLSF